MSPNQDKAEQRRVVWARLQSHHSNLASRLSQQRNSISLYTKNSTQGHLKLSPATNCCFMTPRILYGVDIWAPPSRRKEGDKLGRNRLAINKLTTVQRAGTLAIVRGLRTTPSDSLCAHTNILPIHLEIDRVCRRAALRLATLPERHLLTKIARRCVKGIVLGSSVRSSLSSIFGKTGTGTSLYGLRNHKRPDRTDVNRFSAVF